MDARASRVEVPALGRNVRGEKEGNYAGGRHAADPMTVGSDDGDRLQQRLRELRNRPANHNAGTTLEPIPGINGMTLATRYVEGGRQRVLEYIHLAALNGVESAVKWWHVYADLSPYQRTRVSLDDVCWAAGVKPDELTGTIVSTAMKQSIEVASLVAASMHPDIVRQAGKSAKRIGGRYSEIAFKDRLLMLQSTGFAPLPKGAGTSVHVHNTASASAEAAAASKSDSSVPTFSDDMDVIGGAVLGVHKLPSGRQNTLEGDFRAGDGDLVLPTLDAEPVRR